MKNQNKKLKPIWVYLGLILGLVAFQFVAYFLIILLNDPITGNDFLYFFVVQPYYALIMAIISMIANNRLKENCHLVKHFWIATGIYSLIIGATCTALGMPPFYFP